MAESDPDVFISYSQQVPEPTVAVADFLTRRGFRPWYDVNLLPGEFFGKVIDDAIDKAQAVVTIWSPPAITSKWVPAESARALDQKKLLCVRTEDVDPQTLPTPFHTMHVPIWEDLDGICQALVALGVRPSGISGEVTDSETLRNAAQEEWRMMDRDNRDTLEAFLEEYGQLAMYRRMAQKRLDALASSAVAVSPPAPPEPPRLVRPEDVFLRLDPEMHTAVIQRIDVSADGKLLATASHDKTVKLWSLPEGRLLRTLRPPIGNGDEGKVYAVALDPAGTWVAAGGWEKGASPTNLACFVTLFDAETGAMRARLGPLPNVIFDLAVSPGGAFLAAGLGGENGVRIWELSRVWQGTTDPAFVDTDFGDSAYDLAFGPEGTPAAGRLAVTSWDGWIRLYDGPSDFELRVSDASPGSQPSGIAFSPDGSRLAVGYDDAPRVDLLDAASLQSLGSADVAGLSGGDLNSVAFLPPALPGEAHRLAAGGSHGPGSEAPIFVWKEAGAGARSTWPGPENTVMDLAPLSGSGGGALAFGAADPAFGLIQPGAAGGERPLFRGPVIADLRDKRFEHFTLSPNGTRLRFGLEQWSDQPALFDLAARQLSDAPDPLRDLDPANTDRLAIEGWINTTEPTLNGRALPLEPYETAFSLAIAPDGGSFVLGTHFCLRRFDSEGQSLWKKDVPGTVWGVNLACEGQLIVAAYGDGTIRWHRAESGEELLALFIHLKDGPADTAPQDREWILFTPEGYFEASSPEAEDLIGWHVNRGPDEAADFYPAHTFASVYRDPGKIDAALAEFAS